ncbi:MAG: GNAT family N-acetyltransferase [Deltaproteobacteria bacterium]|nr:GNAT family N-acetyltransferase [Deltaproteobacteria bacterium]
MAKPPPIAREVTLRDGQRVMLRPLAPADKPRIQEGMTRLSRQTRFRRFLSPIRELSEAQLDQLTDLDYDDRMAWAAFPVDNPELGLGIARYHRLAQEPTAAEAAVVVVDSHQSLGLGSAMLSVLSQSAIDNGIRTFHAFVMADNEPMLKILRGAGARMTPDAEGIVRVETPLPDRATDLPGTATGRLFKAVAEERIPAPGVRFLHDDVLLKAVRAFSHWQARLAGAPPCDDGDDKAR